MAPFHLVPVFVCECVLDRGLVCCLVNLIPSVSLSNSLSPLCVKPGLTVEADKVYILLL